MKVVLLAGGQGTRLREETEYRPKPLVEIGGRPILWHIMKTFALYGFHEFIICLGYKGQMIKEYFLNYEAMTNDLTLRLGRSHSVVYHDAHNEQDFCITLADTGLETMTGGRVKRVARYIDDDLFAVTYGDGVADVNIRELVKFHRDHGKLATVMAYKPISRFGLLELSDASQVTAFAEKPQADSWINAGYFIFHRKVLDYIDGDDCILEHQPLEKLAHAGQLVAYRHTGFFYAMDTYREYKVLNDLWNSGKAPWKMW
ncbi:MAG: glucose-1-phosphate cytidylyltransferase [Candidatus Binatia bacterium]